MQCMLHMQVVVPTALMLIRAQQQSSADSLEQQTHMKPSTVRHSFHSIGTARHSVLQQRV